MEGPREENPATVLPATSRGNRPEPFDTHRCELVVAPTAMADGASPGESMVFSVGNAVPVSPSFPPAQTTSMPARTAFSTAAASGSQGVVPVSPQAAP